MVSDRLRSADGRADRLTRRRLLAAAGATAAVGLAGCEAELDVGDDEEGPGLPSTALDDLELAETARESRAMESNDGADDEEPPTREYVSYHRGPARGQPTAIEAFAGTVNGTRGAGSTMVATLGDAGIREIDLALDDEEGSIPATDVSVVIPAGARRDGDVRPDRTLLLTPMSALADYGGAWFPATGSDQTVRPDSMLELSPSNHRLVPAGEFLPDDDWLSPAGTDHEPPVEKWVGSGDAEFPKRDRVLVVTGEHTIDDVFGRDAEDLGGRSLEDGEEVDARQTLLAWPGDQFVPGPPILPWDEVQAASRPAPLGGATFGLGVFVLPMSRPGVAWSNDGRASIEAELQTETGMEAVAEFVLGADGSVFWSDAPTMVELFRPIRYDLHEDLSGESELASLVAVVETDYGREAVALHAGWIPPRGNDNSDVDDAVIVVGGHRAPVGELQDSGWWDRRDQIGEENWPIWLSDGQGEHWADWIEAGSELTGAAVAELEDSR